MTTASGPDLPLYAYRRFFSGVWYANVLRNGDQQLYVLAPSGSSERLTRRVNDRFPGVVWLDAADFWAKARELTGKGPGELPQVTI